MRPFIVDAAARAFKESEQDGRRDWARIVLRLGDLGKAPHPAHSPQSEAREGYPTTIRAPRRTQTTLIFGKEALGTDFSGVFGDQLAFSADPRRPDRLHGLFVVENTKEGRRRRESPAQAAARYR